MTIRIYLILTYPTLHVERAPSTPSGPFLPPCVPPRFSQSFGNDVDTSGNVTAGQNSSPLLWGCYGNTNASGVDSGRRGQHRIRGETEHMDLLQMDSKRGCGMLRLGIDFFFFAAGKSGQLGAGRAGGGRPHRTLQAFCPNQAGGVYKLWLGDSHLQASPLVPR